MIYVDFELNVRKNKTDTGWVKCDTSGLLSKNKEDYNLILTDEHNHPIKIIPCDVIEDETLFFFIDDTIPIGNYFYSVVFNKDDNVEVFLSQLKFNVKEVLVSVEK